MRNVHDIAIELEHILRTKFGITERPRGTIFDADSIERYMFYDDMNLVLTLFSEKDCTEFLDDIYEYKGINMNKIPDCDKIFDKFKTYL